MGSSWEYDFPAAVSRSKSAEAEDTRVLITGTSMTTIRKGGEEEDKIAKRSLKFKLNGVWPDQAIEGHRRRRSEGWLGQRKLFTFNQPEVLEPQADRNMNYSTRKQTKNNQTIFVRADETSKPKVPARFLQRLVTAAVAVRNSQAQAGWREGGSGWRALPACFLAVHHIFSMHQLNSMLSIIQISCRGFTGREIHILPPSSSETVPGHVHCRQAAARHPNPVFCFVPSPITISSIYFCSSVLFCLFGELRESQERWRAAVL